jgi:dipeptide transport system substrate-binding protein
VLDEWKAGAYVRLKARPDHWRGKPRTDTLFFTVQKDTNQRMSALRKGEVHLAPVLSPTVVGDRSKLQGCTVVDVPIPSLGYVMFNLKKEVTEPRALRLALNYAIDRQSICDGLLEGTSIPATGIIPPGMLGHRETKPGGFTYDPDKARKMIADAGLTGTKIRMHCFNEARPYNTVGTRLVQRLQEDFRKVGVEVELVQMDFGGFLETIDTRTVHEMAFSGWMSDTGDPDNFIYYLFGSPSNRSNYENPEANKLMLAAQSEQDPAKRAELYQQAEDLILQDPPAVFVNHAQRVEGMSTRLRGYKPHPIMNTALWNAYLVK